MGNLRKGRVLRKTCTLWELHLRCNDFGKLRIKVILDDAGIPYGFHKGVFSYFTEDALAAIHKHRKAAGKKRRMDEEEPKADTSQALVEFAREKIINRILKEGK